MATRINRYLGLAMVLRFTPAPCYVLQPNKDGIGREQTRANGCEVASMDLYRLRYKIPQDGAT